MSFWEKAKAYKLNVRIIIATILFVIFVLSIVLYTIKGVRENPILDNLILALFTSLLVTVFTMVAEIIVSYDAHKSEEYLEDMHNYGIGNLHLNKQQAVKTLLQDCDSEIWLSGYRLIMTRALKDDIAAAIQRGADICAVLCPPWTDVYRMVYGNDKVLNNYFDVFHTISNAKKKAAETNPKVQKNEYKVYFLNKPIFNDTYKVDQSYVTGPYMHNYDPDDKEKKITAKDFFAYEIVRNSDLYQLVENEFKTLQREAVAELDWDRFDEAYKEYMSSDLTEAEKSKLLQSAQKNDNDQNNK